MRSITILIDGADRESLLQSAASNDRTFSSEVRRAIRAYLADPDGADRTLRQPHQGADRVVTPTSETSTP